MDAFQDNPREGGPALDPVRVVRFRRVSIPAIIVTLVLFAAGALALRALFPKTYEPNTNRIIGETYTNLYLYFGAPQGENDDGQGGKVLHYDEFQVIGDHFEKREFRIFVNADGRVYQYERD